MKIEYVSHACLSIETADARIVTDPWFNGGAYCNQWHVFPRPVNTEILNQADVLLISHGHEDHLHEATLKLLPKSARVLTPYSLFGGTREFIESLGFSNVRETVSYRRYRLSPKTSVTFLLNSHDSIMVIEADGEVLINVNDALHSYPEKVISFHLEEIRKLWGKIDYVFCGFGGASYFPNTIHLPGKRDPEIAIVREQFFAHNFCRIVAGLQPGIAIPFAADFVLLSPEQRWINHHRFPRSKMKAYYQRYFGNGRSDQPQIFDMYPGDRLESRQLRAESPYRKQMRNGSLDHLIEAQYGKDLADFARRPFLSAPEVEQLGEKIRQNAAERAALYGPDRLKGLKFCVHITDVAEENFYHLAMEDGVPKVWRGAAAEQDVLLTMRTRSEILFASLSGDWGGDAIAIGYGAEIHFSDTMEVDVKWESICVDLLARYPGAKDALKRSPLRVAEFLLRSPLKYTRSLKQLKKYNLESNNSSREVWLRKSAAEIRRIHHLPELDLEYLPPAREKNDANDL